MREAIFFRSESCSGNCSPAAVCSAVMKALERNPVLRYQSAQELERALAEHVFAQAKGLEDTDTSAFLKHIFSDIQQASGGGIGSEAPGGSPATAGRAARSAQWLVTGRAQPGRIRVTASLWRGVFLLGIAMLAISTPVLLLHLRPRSSFAIASSDGWPERPSAVVEASPAASIERFATAASILGADSLPILAPPPEEIPPVSGRTVKAK